MSDGKAKWSEYTHIAEDFFVSFDGDDTHIWICRNDIQVKVKMDKVTLDAIVQLRAEYDEAKAKTPPPAQE